MIAWFLGLTGIIRTYVKAWKIVAIIERALNRIADLHR